MACAWFGEISSYSSLTALPGPAWVLLSKICKPFAGSLYRKGLIPCSPLNRAKNKRVQLAYMVNFWLVPNRMSIL